MSNYKVIKLVVLGNSGLGKTYIIKEICNMYFNGFKTIGVDFDTKIINYGGDEYKIQFWDCAGDERYSNIIRSYFNNTKYFIIFFNADTKSYVSDIRYWINELNYKKNSKTIYKYSILLIGLYTKDDYLEEINEYIESQFMTSIFLNKNNINEKNFIYPIIEMYNEDNKCNLNKSDLHTKLLKSDNKPCNDYCNIS